jgi:hypothetical protein
MIKHVTQFTTSRATPQSGERRRAAERAYWAKQNAANMHGLDSFSQQLFEYLTEAELQEMALMSPTPSLRSDAA